MFTLSAGLFEAPASLATTREPGAVFAFIPKALCFIKLISWIFPTQLIMVTELDDVITVPFY